MRPATFFPFKRRLEIAWSEPFLLPPDVVEDDKDVNSVSRLQWSLLVSSSGFERRSTGALRMKLQVPPPGALYKYWIIQSTSCAAKLLHKLKTSRVQSVKTFSLASVTQSKCQNVSSCHHFKWHFAISLANQQGLAQKLASCQSTQHCW